VTAPQSTHPVQSFTFKGNVIRHCTDQLISEEKNTAQMQGMTENIISLINEEILFSLNK